MANPFEKLSFAGWEPERRAKALRPERARGGYRVTGESGGPMSAGVSRSTAATPRMRGNFATAASRAELEAKFDAVAAPALAGPSRARVRSAGRDLARLTSLTDLMDALVAEDSASRGPAPPTG